IATFSLLGRQSVTLNIGLNIGCSHNWDNRPSEQLAKCNIGQAVARIPRFSHISTFMTEQLHWLPLSARILFKIIFPFYKAFLSLAPSYLCKLIMRPLSASSDRPLRSLVRNDLLVPRSGTSTSQQCAFASAGPLLWNCLPVKPVLKFFLARCPLLLAFLSPFFFLGLITLEGASD